MMFVAITLLIAYLSLYRICGHVPQGRLRGLIIGVVATITIPAITMAVYAAQARLSQGPMTAEAHGEAAAILAFIVALVTPFMVIIFRLKQRLAVSGRE